jgi:hypothetical protein
MGTVEQITVNGWDCSTLVIPLDGGYRVKFAEEQWDHIGSWRGDIVAI